MTEQERPTLKVMSFGAGVQSITQALLIAEGKLEKPDAAIFSDTGWEPAGVYAMLDRVEEEIFKPLGIPLYRVNNGVIQDDVLNPDKMRGIPGFTASLPYEVEVVDRWGICPDETCGWRKLRAVVDASDGNDELLSLFDVSGLAFDTGDLGGLFMAVAEVPDRATLAQLTVIADYWQPDPDDEYDVNHAMLIIEALRRAGLRRLPEKHAACQSMGIIPTASHTEIRRDYGMLNRKCTQTYKLQPILEQVRLLLGGKVGEEKPCRFCEGEGRRVAPWRAKRGETTVGECSVCEGTGTISRVGPPPASVWAEQWIGFSTDEIGRVSNRGDTRYSRSRYPLLELEMSRQQCIDYLTARGWADVTKSSCLGCPFKSNAEWRRLRDTDPQAWAEVVAFDKVYREGAGMKHQRFLHASCLPLDEAPIDAQQAREWKPSTVTDQVYAAQLQRAEEGDPDGCSPYACRSGNAA
jgi:hypothetical protein